MQGEPIPAIRLGRTGARGRQFSFAHLTRAAIHAQMRNNPQAARTQVVLNGRLLLSQHRPVSRHLRLPATWRV